MGFFSSLWGKNSENGKNTQNNTPTVQQPRMTEAQRHDAFVQSLRENTANGKYGPVPTQSTARKAATQAAYYDQARRWLRNYQSGYVSGDEDILGYYFQPVEADARAYAKEETERLQELISRNLQEDK